MQEKKLVSNTGQDGQGDRGNLVGTLGKLGQKKGNEAPGSLDFPSLHTPFFYYLFLTFKAIHTWLPYTRYGNCILELSLKY